MRGMYFRPGGICYAEIVVGLGDLLRARVPNLPPVADLAVDAPGENRWPIHAIFRAIWFMLSALVLDARGDFHRSACEAQEEPAALRALHLSCGAALVG